ncbi:MAG: hypothetical protein K0S57_2827 [Ramlibacter sp.]|nr:hypothetical protein [Ramlibacter sp.]
MTISVDAWQRLWTELGAAEVPRGLFNQLVAAYSERPKARDNEERSADWAARSILAADCDAAVAERVRALVLATDGHAASDDADTQFLLDVDLAILGAAPARFAEYERQVRAEYAHVPDAEFRSRRAQVLGTFLARPRIYGTVAFHDALEQRARDNLQQAVAALRP